MIKLLAVIFAAGVSASLVALDERDQLNLKVPSNLEKNQLLVQIQHRFYGSLKDPTFGMSYGANDGVGLRYPVLSRLEVNGSFVIEREEFSFGASYAFYFRPAFLRSQIDCQYFNAKLIGSDSFPNQRTGGVFGLLSLQSEPILKTFTPVVNVGYDSENRRFGIGVGLTAQRGIDMPPFKSVAIVGEFFPVVQPDSLTAGLENCFAVGLKFETWGHHFIFMVGNSFEIGTRYWMLGSIDSGLHLGFNINRMIDLGGL